jgi:arginine-tRNA-protein transferase
VSSFPSAVSVEGGVDRVTSSFRYLAGIEPCGYLPGQDARMEYEYVAELTAEEYAARMVAGWRRFGHTLFRPQCPRCQACRSLRVDVERFRPSRSQRRARNACEAEIALRIGEPRVSLARLELSWRFHALRAETRGWRGREDDPISFYTSFVSNPFPTEEWCYSLDGELVGLGHVDALSVGLSAIYFVHDPAQRCRGLGTWNILCLIDEARRRGLPHVYLGYWVADCLSLAYKSRFHPHQVMGPDGRWHDVQFSAGTR